MASLSICVPRVNNPTDCGVYNVSVCVCVCVCVCACVCVCVYVCVSILCVYVYHVDNLRIKGHITIPFPC